MESIETLISNTEIKSAKSFGSLAEKIIKNYCIKCGDKEYRFAEIEFYYYDKDVLNEEWNRKTYPRTAKPGQLFFHYSGVDICFGSSIEDGYFGGILIRSLYDEKENRYITGPLLCMNEILNHNNWPTIVPSTENVCDIETTKRYGITYTSNEFDDKLCYFDKRLKVNSKKTSEKVTWDYAHKRPKVTTRNYTKRFNNGE